MLLMAALPTMAMAGAPGGLQIVLIGTDKAAEYRPAIDDFFKRYNPDNGESDCEDTQLNIDSVYAPSTGSNITPELAVTATRDKKQRVKLGRSMTRFRDAQHKRGLDGALLYDIQNDKIILYGISAMSSVKVYASALPLPDLRNPKKTSQAICHALVQLPVLAEP